jgi:hypothetical protein
MNGQFYPKKLVSRCSSIYWQEERGKMNSNPTLENQLNAAIAERGYRISPRAPLADRLARYIQMTYSTRGREVDNEEAQAVAEMMMMKHRTASLDDDIQEPPTKRRRTVRVNEEGDMRVTIGGGHCMTRRSQVARQPSPSAAEGTHSMTRRSQVNTSRRSSPSPAPAVSTQGTHSMVRRSQVARR